jgi:hypothetical protein
MSAWDTNWNSGIGNLMLDKTQAEQIQDPELADVGEEEEAKAEDVGLTDPGLDVQLGLDPAAPFQPVLPLPRVVPSTTTTTTTTTSTFTTPIPSPSTTTTHHVCCSSKW